ncbi:MAG: L-lactate dehydrogenase [Bacteroides sp.]|nr:L-lactate dehydrogenase [Bacteroides sp.]
MNEANAAASDAETEKLGAGSADDRAEKKEKAQESRKTGENPCKGPINHRKAAIIGCGFVGSSIAFTLMQRGLFSEMVLIDRDEKKAEGEALDISHGLPYSAPMEIYAGDYDDLSDAAFIVIAAGANQKQGETRLDLIDKNLSIFSQIIPEITKRDCQGILLIVTNPVDILTYAAIRMSGFSPQRVIGSGTVLDTARLKYLIGRSLDVDARSVHAVIIGEHGDSELAVWSGANISGVDLNHFCELRGMAHYKATTQRIYAEVRDSAYEIIQRKGATYYGIAMAVAKIAESISRDEHSILPVSALLTGEYGIEGLCLSIPSVVGSKGVEKVLEIPLSGTEQRELTASAKALAKAVEHADKAAEEMRKNQKIKGSSKSYPKT